MSVQLINISELTVNPNNPRIIKDEKFDKLVQSIKEFPDMLKYRPIVVDENNVILGGNMRFKACKAAKLKQVHVMKASELTEAQKREFIIKDNVSGGEWDWAMLQNEWDTEQLDAWGLDIPSFETEQALEAVEDDYEVPDEIQTDIVLGDIFEIGEHRLLCGDSTDSDAVAKLMDGQKADMIFTDPPYGINYKSNKRKEEFDFIKNDDVIDCSFLPIIPVNNNVAFYIWTRWDVYPKWVELVEQSYKVTSCIVWAKQAGGLGDLESFWNQHEFAIYAVNGKVKLRGKRQGNLWETQDHRSKDYVHPTQKPIELPARGIEATSDVGNIIVDVFLGSGSTMVASHQLKRKCYGMELDPKYCQVIIDRMIKLDPTLTIKRNGQPYLQRKNSDAKT
jgi:DNA modification methylase